MSENFIVKLLITITTIGWFIIIVTLALGAVRLHRWMNREYYWAASIYQVKDDTAYVSLRDEKQGIDSFAERSYKELLAEGVSVKEPKFSLRMKYSWFRWRRPKIIITPYKPRELTDEDYKKANRLIKERFPTPLIEE